MSGCRFESESSAPTNLRKIPFFKKECSSMVECRSPKPRMEVRILPLLQQKFQFFIICVYGGVAEWSIAAVLKTVGRNSPVGSNPTPSANF